MIHPLGFGLFREVTAPRSGRQDVGESPGGPQDRFAWASARILLGGTPDIRTWELVAPPAFEVEEDGVAVCTGGGFDRICCADRKIEHATVFKVKAGERITWGIRTHGFRTVVALRPGSSKTEDLAGLARGSFTEAARWPGQRGTLRVLAGPEAGNLQDAEAFLKARWVTSPLSNDAGLRLEGGGSEAYTGSLREMVSAPVADGTLQLTPDGLILLLRSRPTQGGYPRVFTVIGPDVDLAAQIPPRRRVRFEPVTLEMAVAVRRQQQTDLDRLRNRVRAWRDRA
jgi:allophanate hydrolase subunit 2